jgi:hypothetical protein
VRVAYFVPHHVLNGIYEFVNQELIDWNWYWTDALQMDPATPEGLVTKERHHCGRALKRKQERWLAIKELEGFCDHSSMMQVLQD